MATSVITISDLSITEHKLTDYQNVPKTHLQPSTFLIFLYSKELELLAWKAFKMHKNVYGCAPPVSAGELTMLPRLPSWFLGVLWLEFGRFGTNRRCPMFRYSGEKIPMSDVYLFGHAKLCRRGGRRGGRYRMADVPRSEFREKIPRSDADV